MGDPVQEFLRVGRLMEVGIRTPPPTLPPSPQAMQGLEREAERDPRVRRAMEASLLEAELARQAKPQTLIRNCGTILKIR